VKHTSGKYVAFLDSDDLWKPDKLEKQVAFFEEHPDIRLCHTDEIWIRNGKRVNQRRKHRKEGGRIFRRSLHLCLISPSAVMMHRSLYEEYGGFDREMEVGEDYHLWLRITAHEEVGFIPEPLTVKRGGHADQLSAKYGQIEIFRIQALEKILARETLSPAQAEAARAVYREKCRIYAQGCEKRGKKREAAEYLEKSRRAE
jgi:glycosyltransferase involved in cell wall biosynthesis